MSATNLCAARDTILWTRTSVHWNPESARKCAVTSSGICAIRKESGAAQSSLGAVQRVRAGERVRLTMGL
eukprot:3384239-Prymnesium_polylepis.2